MGAQFDSLTHSLSTFSKELATDPGIKLLRVSGIARYANKLMGECRKVQSQTDKVE